jgi:hypothetical protein
VATNSLLSQEARTRLINLIAESERESLNQAQPY